MQCTNVCEQNRAFQRVLLLHRISYGAQRIHCGVVQTRPIKMTITGFCRT